jgi:hypothetical protein
MRTKIFKCLVVGCLALGLQTASAQLSVYDELVPGSCSHMSKNPRCWEDKDPTQQPRPTMCHSKDSCHIIKSVQLDNWGQFQCKAINGQVFSCDTLVEQLGTQLEGVLVKVTTPYVDGCHILGGCGSRGCVPSYGAASLDQACH